MQQGSEKPGQDGPGSDGCIDARPEITFLGLGLMGQPMAARLVAAGYPVTVWNRTPGKQIAGARVAHELAQALCGADLVISMLSDGSAVQAVLDLAIAARGTQEEPDVDGMACAGQRALMRGSCWIDMSSTRQDEAGQMARQLAAIGVDFVDAPVSGGVIGAEAGTLAIMAGAEPAVFARIASVLQALGRPTRVGPVGCGQLAKLCNQLIVGASLQMVAEALLLAQAGGADPALVRQALCGGFADSKVLQVHGGRMLERNFLPGGQIKTQHKDMQNILAAASAAGLNLPLTQLISTQFAALLADWPGADQAAALLGLEKGNPGQRLGTAADRLP
jgi:2-hydroxy-3-oxopropionate reductase